MNDNASPHNTMTSAAEVALRDFIDKELPHLRAAAYSDQLQTVRNAFAFGWNAGYDHRDAMAEKDARPL